jgi:hypothetical protein
VINQLLRPRDTWFDYKSNKASRNCSSQLSVGLSHNVDSSSGCSHWKAEVWRRPCVTARKDVVWHIVIIVVNERKWFTLYLKTKWWGFDIGFVTLVKHVHVFFFAAVTNLLLGTMLRANLQSLTPRLHRVWDWDKTVYYNVYYNDIIIWSMSWMYLISLTLSSDAYIIRRPRSQSLDCIVSLDLHAWHISPTIFWQFTGQEALSMAEDARNDIINVSTL